MVDLQLENEYASQGFKCVCGIDEAGRGPLAGPVYAAAVILPEGCVIEGLDDSKKLSEKKREALFDVICERAVSFAVGSADEKEIDEINILNATFLAMKRAVEGLKERPDLCLVDGNREPHIAEDIKEVTVIKGDSKSMSIAAASVLAKVSRDRYMLALAKEYPEYEFQKHKGYGTKLHYEKIREYGISDIHRRSFLKKITGE
ncbi:MAG: ribonuclease HII [Clostridia bacterium]|nr:ribonuclease HII [Clostridia bacterium]